MTALAKDRKTTQFGTPDNVFPGLLAFPVAAATLLFAGGLVATNAAGNAVKGSADPTLKIWGVLERQADNSAGAAADINALIKQGAFFLAQTGTTITKAHAGMPVYVVDDQTISLDDAGGLRPLGGYVLGVRADAQVAVQVGIDSPYGTGGASPAAEAFNARAVLTSVAAYTAAAGTITANANGAIGAQDGVTMAAGDLVLLPEGTAAAAKDAGPYVVSAVGDGSSKFVLVRPGWWAFGSTIPAGEVVEVGGEGTLWKGSSWKSFATFGNKVVDTDAPLFWPRSVNRRVVLVAGTVNVAAPIRSVTETMVHITRAIANTSTATTGGYAAEESQRTAGVVGTGEIDVEAKVAAGTINNADISTLDVSIINW